jgi:hypothetical protein
MIVFNCDATLNQDWLCVYKYITLKLKCKKIICYNQSKNKYKLISKCNISVDELVTNSFLIKWIKYFTIPCIDIIPSLNVQGITTLESLSHRLKFICLLLMKDVQKYL